MTGLASLDDHMRRDVGLSRGDIERARLAAVIRRSARRDLVTLETNFADRRQTSETWGM
jgi:hypothetical protein